MILAEPILITLFQYGELQSRDVAMAALSLRAYTLGLIAFMLIKVLAPGFFACQDTKTPVKIGIYAMVANMVFNIALVVPLHYYLQIGHVGLALATAMSAWLNAMLLLRGLLARQVYRPAAGWLRYTLQLCVPVVLMSALLLLCRAQISDWSLWSAWQRAAVLGGVCAAGGVTYLLGLLLMGLRPAQLRGGANPPT